MNIKVYYNGSDRKEKKKKKRCKNVRIFLSNNVSNNVSTIHPTPDYLVAFPPGQNLIKPQAFDLLQSWSTTVQIRIAASTESERDRHSSFCIRSKANRVHGWPAQSPAAGRSITGVDAKFDFLSTEARCFIGSHFRPRKVRQKTRTMPTNDRAASSVIHGWASPLEPCIRSRKEELQAHSETVISTKMMRRNAQLELICCLTCSFSSSSALASVRPVDPPAVLRPTFLLYHHRRRYLQLHRGRHGAIQLAFQGCCPCRSS